MSCKAAGPVKEGGRQVEDVLALLEARWTLRILLLLAERRHRFSDLRQRLPAISANILTHRIRALEDAGFVDRVTLPLPAGLQVYALSQRASDLLPMLAALRRWRDQQTLAAPDDSRSTTADIELASQENIHALHALR